MTASAAIVIRCRAKQECFVDGLQAVACSSFDLLTTCNSKTTTTRRIAQAHQRHAYVVLSYASLDPVNPDDASAGDSSQTSVTISRMTSIHSNQPESWHTQCTMDYEADEAEAHN